MKTCTHTLCKTLRNLYTMFSPINLSPPPSLLKIKIINVSCMEHNGEYFGKEWWKDRKMNPQREVENLQQTWECVQLPTLDVTLHYTADLMMWVMSCHKFTHLIRNIIDITIKVCVDHNPHHPSPTINLFGNCSHWNDMTIYLDIYKS